MSTASDPFVFPITDMNVHLGPLGLTKRELFAALAMAGMLACSGRVRSLSEVEARLAVDYADALIAALDTK